MTSMSETKTSTVICLSYQSQVQTAGVSAKTPISDPGDDGTTFSATETKTGNKLHNWKRKIAQGHSATTTFSGSRQTFATIPARYDLYGCKVNPPQDIYLGRCATNWSHDILSIPTLPGTTDVNAAANIAATKFNKKLQDTLTAFQGGVFLAELRETLHMIRNPAKALREKISKYSEHLRKNRGKMLRRPESNRLRFLSDSWLEYAFGWSPLLNDLNQASNILNKRQNQLVKELIPILGIGKVERTSFWNGNWTQGYANLSCFNRQIVQTMRVYAGAVSSRASGTPLLTMNALGLSPRSFVPTLWEAMPYSFLIDYFTNVGDVIEAWSNQSADLAWGRDTSRRSIIVESGKCLSSVTVFPLVFSKSLVDGKTIARNSTVSRVAMSSSPLPALQFELPGFGRKWINLSALATARRSLRYR